MRDDDGEAKRHILEHLRGIGLHVVWLWRQYREPQFAARGDGPGVWLGQNTTNAHHRGELRAWAVEDRAGGVRDAADDFPPNSGSALRKQGQRSHGDLRPSIGRYEAKIHH